LEPAQSVSADGDNFETMNRPAKGFTIPRTFFTLKVRCAGKPSVTKVLQGPVEGSYVGDGHSLVPSFRKNDVGQGLPHFRKVNFIGHFPFATVRMEDPEIPLCVFLEAFRPFIPLNDKDSSIPIAILSYTFENTGGEVVSATIYGNLTNIIGDCKINRINKASKEKAVTGLYLTTSKSDDKSPRYGSMVLATTWPHATIWPRWEEDLHLFKFWEAVALSDEFPPKGDGKSDTGTVAADFVVKPREQVTVTFFLAMVLPHI